MSPGGKSCWMNSLFSPGELVGLLVVEAGEAPAEALPEEALAVLRERRHQLGEHRLAEAVREDRHVEEADEGELLARRSARPAHPRVHHQAADLGGAVEVVADREDLVAEVAVERGGVVLPLGDVEEGAGRLAGAVLGDDHRGAEHAAAARVLEHEDVAAPQRVRDAPGEAPHRPLDDAGERPLVGRAGSPS